MFDLKSIEYVNTRLINLLLTIPFPDSKILYEQIYKSSCSNTVFPDYYCIHFKTDKFSNHLSYNLDEMPLSWQMIADGDPVLCQLFIKSGYVDKLEVMNLVYKDIPWEKVWEASLLLDFEYDIQNIINYIVGKEISINKILHFGGNLDLDIESQDKCFVVSFRNCKVRKLKSASEQCVLSIDKLNDAGASRYAVLSDNGAIDFDCDLIFIQWHKKLCSN